MKVASILKRKGTDVVTVRPDVTIAAAARELAGKGIGALVVSEDGRTTRVVDLRVRDVMARRVVTCTPDGIVSIGDVVKHRLEALETEANILREAFIARH